MDSATVKRVGIEKAQNFMRQYRDPESRELKKLSANQFMDVWSHYDKDGEFNYSGQVDAETTVNIVKLKEMALKFSNLINKMVIINLSTVAVNQCRA